jgi:hypothetical protein
MNPIGSGSMMTVENKKEKNPMLATVRSQLLIKALVGVVTAVPCIQACAQSFNSGLVAYYPFNGNANDASGNSNNGSVFGASLTTNRFGTPNSAYSFVGNGTTFISIPDSPSLDITNSVTVTAWIRSTGGGYAQPRIVSKKVYQLLLSDTSASPKVIFALDGFPANVVSPSVSLSQNNWLFLAGTYDGLALRVYTNGGLAAQLSATGSMAVNNEPVGIGENLDDNSDFVNGEIDDVRIYNRALTSTELQQLYAFEATSQGQLTDGLVAYYPFNGNANDASGNNNNGNAGTAQLAPDRFGTPNAAYFFNGTNSFITFTKPPTTNVDNISMFCWLNPAVLPQWGIALKLGYSDGNLPCNGYGLGIGSGVTEHSSTLFSENACIKWVSSGVVFGATGRWDHVGFIRQNGTDYFYLDGNLVASQQVATPAAPTAFCIGTLLGSDQLNAVFNGSIDDVRVYERALSSDEVRQLYQSKAGPQVTLIKAVVPSFSHLFVGTNYQLQVSTDMSSWTNQGQVFTATNASMLYPQYFSVEDWSDLFFRLQKAP